MKEQGSFIPASKDSIERLGQLVKKNTGVTGGRKDYVIDARTAIAVGEVRNKFGLPVGHVTTIYEIAPHNQPDNQPHLDGAAHKATMVGVVDGISFVSANDLFAPFLGDSGRPKHTMKTTLGKVANGKDQVLFKSRYHGPSQADIDAHLKALADVTPEDSIDFKKNNASEIAAKKTARQNAK